MRICLINPPRIIPKDWGIPNIFQPLGLAYVAAVLEKDHHVMVIDAPAEDWRKVRELDMLQRACYYLGLEYEEIATKVERFSPDIVGVTVPFTVGARSALEVARTVKNIDPNIFTILGGPHPSVKPFDCILNPEVDFLVIGEGEQTICKLVDLLEKGTYDKVREVEGLVYKANGKPASNPPISLQDLDSIPFPARHLLPMNEYFAAGKKGQGPREDLRKNWATMITSRGCPYGCVFCSIHIVMGRKFRARSPTNVCDEIEQVVGKHNVRQIDFEDDNMTLDKKRMEDLCDEILERGLDIEWYTPNGIRADLVHRNLLLKMKKSGCKRIWISPESGVQRVVTQIVKKNLDLSKVEKVVSLCKKVGIKVSCFFVIGLIGETKYDIKNTIRFAHRLKKLGADRFHFNIASPYYGTELYDKALEKGYLRTSYSDEFLSTHEPVIETPEFTSEEIHEFYEYANSVLNPIIRYFDLLRALKNPKRALDFLVKRISYKVCARAR